MDILSGIKRVIKNLPGKKTGRKLVCIYMDDYGSIRVKDKMAYETLKTAGIPMDRSRYAKFDTMASTEDLQMLFEVLTSVKDVHGNYACATPFIIMANPDFERIRESGFTRYFREPFTDTLKKYGSSHEGVFKLWKQGIAEKVFHPEYHGTEHINVVRFMEALQQGHRSTLLAFDNQSIAIPTFSDEKPINHASTSFYIETAIENENLKNDIRTGLELFEDLLGYRSRQFTPGAGVYSPVLHSVLKEEGIDYINVQRYYSYPLGDGKFTKKLLYNGKMNEVGQRYVVRNCVFEPYHDDCAPNSAALSGCIKNVEAAFRMHAPAIISTHRVNFVGGLESSHRDDSLTQLKTLLTEIVKRWPDVEFMDGDQMCDTVFLNKK